MKSKIQCFFWLLITFSAHAQDDVMMQAFYWNVPYNKVNREGTWYNNISTKLPELRKAGITALWMPPPCKGNWGVDDNGYGIFDHYDLGNYFQKGSAHTRFGSKEDLQNLIREAHAVKQGRSIQVYADIILNHMYSDISTAMESNPAVKDYVFKEAIVNGSQRVPYQTNAIRWTIKNAQPGAYHIQIAGYFLNWNDLKERGYDVKFSFSKSNSSTTDLSWEQEPNNGNGNFNEVIPGRTYSGHIDNKNDVDEYRIVLNETHDMFIDITAKKEGLDSKGNFEWQWASQRNGYYPKAVWYKGDNIATTEKLQASTATCFSYVKHTGSSEPNYSWNYNHFHPSDYTDFLGDGGANEDGFEDAIATNTDWFGKDLNTFDPVVQERLSNWGRWLTSTMGFDGYRMDFVRGYQPDMLSNWVKNLPKLNGKQRFIVGEYFSNYKYRLKNWVNTLSQQGADVTVFDFPLKKTLTDMTNMSGSAFDMTLLNDAGMIRDNTHHLPDTSVVTFVENHDTGKEHDKWVTKDWKMAYAYILFAEGRPCLFYSHYYGIKQFDNSDNEITVTSPATLRQEINQLIFIRRSYLKGKMDVLTQSGNPVSETNPDNTITFSGDTHNVYIARRQGNEKSQGAILVMNNHDNLVKGLWVDNTSNELLYSNLAGRKLVNLLNKKEVTRVYPDGRVHLWAPARGYSIWVIEAEAPKH